MSVVALVTVVKAHNHEQLMGTSKTLKIQMLLATIQYQLLRFQTRRGFIRKFSEEPLYS